MKIAGFFILVWGLCLAMFAGFYYMIWLTLQSDSSGLTDVDRAFARGYGHGYFVAGIAIGLLISLGGWWLFRRKPPVELFDKPVE